MKLTTANEGMTVARKLPCLLLTPNWSLLLFYNSREPAQIMLMRGKDKDKEMISYLRTRLWPVFESFPDTRVLSILSGLRAGS